MSEEYETKTSYDFHSNRELLLQITRVITENIFLLSQEDIGNKTQLKTFSYQLH